MMIVRGHAQGATVDRLGEPVASLSRGIASISKHAATVISSNTRNHKN